MRFLVKSTVFSYCIFAGLKKTMWLNQKLAHSLTLLPSFSAYFEPFVQALLPLWRADAYRAKVLEVRNELADVYTLVLKPSRLWPGFSAGQHVLLTAIKDGAYQSRTFSISSSPAYFKRTGKIELSIRVQSSGLMTPWFREQFSTALGYVSLSPAQGRFQLPSKPKPLLWIAGGSGITPFRSMLQQLGSLPSAANALDVQLIYCARDAQHHLFKDELIRLATYLPKAKITWLNDQEHGFLSAELIQQYCPDYQTRTAYLCGPAPMLSLARNALASLSVPSEQIFYEYFGAAPLAFPRLGEKGALVAFKKAQRVAQLDPDQPQTLLTMAENLGLKPLSGCRAGVCHQCVCRKDSGVVFNTLTGKDSGTGAEDIQLCVSVPRTDLIVDL